LTLYVGVLMSSNYYINDPILLELNLRGIVSIPTIYLLPKEYALIYSIDLHRIGYYDDLTIGFEVLARICSESCSESMIISIQLKLRIYHDFRVISMTISLDDK
jgi:hypothetical protein